MHATEAVEDGWGVSFLIYLPPCGSASNSKMRDLTDIARHYPENWADRLSSIANRPNRVLMNGFDGVPYVIRDDEPGV